MSSPSQTADVDAGRLPAATRLGPTELVVADLERSLAFYGGPLGLQLVAREGPRALVGTGGEAVLALREEVGARPAGRHAGLYHVALLHPSRLELARAARRLAESRTPIQGASDHGTHEAIYLGDPDGNGLELAADRPPAEWPDIHDIDAIRPNRLDEQSLLGLVAGEESMAQAGAGLVVGHLHLHVNDLAAATAFWTDVVGFDIVFSLDVATFVAAGGYHHHVGLNTWRGVGIPDAPERGVAGMAFGTIVVPTRADVAAVRARAAGAGADATDLPDDAGLRLRDPAGNVVHVVARADA